MLFNWKLFPGTNLQDLNLDWIINFVKVIPSRLPKFSDHHTWLVYDYSTGEYYDSGEPTGGAGEPGPPGKSPIIGANGNWWTWNTTTEAYIDTGTPAEGPEGPRGPGVNQNMLDNWYFLNPVNQRGLTAWTNPGDYTVDRWKLTSGQASLTQSGITLNGTLVQMLENAIGIPVVCSALLSDGTMITPTYNDSTKTFSITATGQTIKAVKLELGSEQTLAHLENDVWVLNEIPDYVQELVKCQRYYLPDCGRLCNAYYYGDASGGVLDISIATPVNMVAELTAELVEGDYVIRASDNSALALNASNPVSVYLVNSNSVSVRISSLTFGNQFAGVTANPVINLKSTI